MSQNGHSQYRTGYQHLVLDYYVDRFREIGKKRRTRLSKIESPEQAYKYQKRVRSRIRSNLGPRPRRTALNAKITGSIRRRHHTIEKVLFESRPDFFVTAHLYIPLYISSPAPAVLGCCGHSDHGKLDPLYQEFCQRLVRAGFVVLIYDPIGQGERDQYWFLSDRTPVLYSMYAHNMMGKQLDLIGEWFGEWRAWDGIRALDYLLTRPEVDARFVGITGNSGGGALTTWLWAMDDRLSMAAPGCSVSTYLSSLENELPQDYEAYFTGLIGAGLDIADLFIARAPDPVILLGQKYDFFDFRGLREAYEDVRLFYDKLNALEDSRDLFVGSEGHGYSTENQEAMVDFFSRHAALERPVKVVKPEHLTAKTMSVTEEGGVGSIGSKPGYALIALRSDELKEKRKQTDEGIPYSLASLLNLPDRKAAPHYRVLRPIKLPGKTFSRYAVETEGAVRAILHRRAKEWISARSLHVDAESRLYLPHIATMTDLMTDPYGRGLARKYPIYGLDVRGTGESRPDEEADFLDPYGMDYMLHGQGRLLGESYLGRRVHDVLATLDLLVAEGAPQVELFGRGQGAILALFAGVLHPAIQSVTLYNAPISFHQWTQVPIVGWPAVNCLFDVLNHFDIPDCIRNLGDRIRIVRPWGPDMRPLQKREIDRLFRKYEIPLKLLSN